MDLKLRDLLAPRNLTNWLFVMVPVAIVLELTHSNPLAIFLAAALAIVPLAGLLGSATERLAASAGEGVGGLLNATFGNAAELIIALVAMRAGLFVVVKASITGSIIGNVLLVLGLSIVAGGFKHKEQRFNLTAASLGSTLLALSAVALVLPAVFHHLVKNNPRVSEQNLSLEIALILLVTYCLSLVFVLKTHAHLYEGSSHEEAGHAGARMAGGRGRSILMLLIATGLIAMLSEFLVGAVSEASHILGLTEIFIGVIVVAIIGNAAEHSTAVLMSVKNKMDLSLNIAIGSSLQIALFVAPVLVLCSYVVAPRPMDLLFTTLEIVAITLSVAIVALIALDGRSNWMEGVLLLAVYAILGLTFYYLPA
jgi:Ca2+:H+ antiporter